MVGPDLIPGGWSVPGTIIPANGSFAILTPSVKNVGTGTAVAPWWEYVFFSTDTACCGGDTAIAGYQRLTDLPAGGQYAPVFNPIAPNVKAGTYYLFFYTDATNQVPEGSETNNVIGPIGITITNGDLQPTALSVPGPVTNGTAATINFSVKNNGPGIAAPTWNDRVVLSANATYGDGDDIELIQVPQPNSVVNGQTYSQSPVVTIPVVPPGTYNLFVETDYGNQLYETNEGNNVKGPVAITVN